MHVTSYSVYSLISLNLKSVLKTMRSVVYRPAVYCDACCFCIKKISLLDSSTQYLLQCFTPVMEPHQKQPGREPITACFVCLGVFLVIFLGGAVPLGQFTTSLYNYMPNSFFCITESWPKRISAQDTSLKLLYSELLLAAAIKIIRRHKCDRHQC